MDWHRDAPLLFAETVAAPARDGRAEAVHARDSGLHLPVYAINVFAALADLSPSIGGTEFALGSHQVSDRPISSVGGAQRRCCAAAATLAKALKAMCGGG